MATITLNYNTKNMQAQKALNYILSLGVFRTETVRRRRSQAVLGKTEAQTKDPFAEIRGIWADRDISAKELRSQAWGRDEYGSL
jgi:hypothetical protein